MCDKCDMYCVDSIEHVLFICHNNVDTHAILWNAIVTNCPPAMVNELNTMDAKAKSMFLLNALFCDYTDEWNTLYIAISQYISTLYYDRINSM